MHDVEKHPIDWASLKKGDVIGVEEMERILGVSRTHRDYSIKLCAFCQRTMDELETRGNAVVCRADHDAMRVLTDAEAAEYLPTKFAKGARIMRNAHRQLQTVDPGGLTDQQQKEMAYQLHRQAMIQAAQQKATRLAITQRPKRIADTSESISNL